MTSPVLEIVPLGSPPWPTLDPFLFCVHHRDDYPAGDENFGPAASLEGRTIGNDFAGIDGWRMYHGDVVPGFPAHPHRGFETVTIARHGYIDHSDSLGAAARFGEGDVQWMTAGRGIVHAEMFPLLDREGPNRAELFQLWLNLPRADKLVEPHFTMLWNDTIPTVDVIDAQGRRSEVRVVAGELAGQVAPAPPPNSWAANPEHGVAIWTVRMQAAATWTMPAATINGVLRAVYAFDGVSVRFDDERVDSGHLVVVDATQSITIEAGEGGIELLVLQARPIGEPVAQYGPFVMNDRAGVQQAFDDYQRTHFGGWPWDAEDPVHGRDVGRFARRIDGTIDTPADTVRAAG